MKRLSSLCFFLFLAGVVLGLIQLWFAVWLNDTFFKIIVTDAALFAVAFVLLYLIRESKESRKITKGNGLD